MAGQGLSSEERTGIILARGSKSGWAGVGMSRGAGRGNPERAGRWDRDRVETRGPGLTLTMAQLQHDCLGKSKKELRPASSLYPRVKGKVLYELEEL